MKNPPIRFVLIAIAGFNLASRAGDFDASTNTVGHGDSGLITPVNQLVTPAGTLIELPGQRPLALALSPDGKLLVTAGADARRTKDPETAAQRAEVSPNKLTPGEKQLAAAGLTHELDVIDPATGKIWQHVPLPPDKAPPHALVSAQILNPDGKAQLSFTGLAFSPDGSRIYMSNVNGDIKVFAVGQDQQVSPLFSMALPPANTPTRKEEIPTGIAVSADGRKIYVAGNLSNRLIELDAATGDVLRTWNVGVAPFDVVLAGNKAYVSNWGGRRPDANSVTGPAGLGTLVRVDDRSIANEGSVSVIDLDAGINQSGNQNAQTEIITGQHASALALSPDGKFLACANSSSDTISVIDTAQDKVIETICARENPADLFGAQPNALAFDRSGKKLFVCNGTQNAVAVFQFQPGESELQGLIPVGWFPGAIMFDAKRNQICVANIKDIATQMERAKGGAIGHGFNTHQYFGSLSLVSVPSKSELATFTQTALADLRYPLLAEAKLPPRPGSMPVPVPERVGEPSVFHHVIYIIKENRSYDQVLGDVQEGNGNADLCIFGERVKPNQHKMVHDFVLLDNLYSCGILSADGHNWTDSGIATDYLEREFAGWPRSYGLGDALNYSPAGFIWNDAMAHGKTVADFGELTKHHNFFQNHSAKELKWVDYYRDFTEHSNAIVYTCEPRLEALRPYIMTNYTGFDLNVPDIIRADQFIKDLKKYEAADNFPNLAIFHLPNDHTSGLRFGSPTPEAQVADNDLALGQIVDAVSHSKFWADTCIFAIEDDPQNGWDHVSGYRTTAYVISPYTRRFTRVNTQYNQTSLLRTIELILGLPPMNQMDATATPMFDCFTSTPDLTPYNVVGNQVPLNEMNKRPKEISDLQLRKDAITSAKLPLEEEDQCPEDLFNHILWDAMKGPHTPYPNWAVKTVDDD